MIYQAADGALLTVMFFLHNACFHLKRGTCCGPTATERVAAGMLFQDDSDSHVLQCAQLTSISNHFSTVAYMIGHTFTLQNPQVTDSEAWKLQWESVWLLVCVAETIVLVCCVRPAGLSVCSLPGVEKGLAVSSQPWPAGLFCPQAAQNGRL